MWPKQELPSISMLCSYFLTFFSFPATHPSQQGNKFLLHIPQLFTLLENIGLFQPQGVAEKLWKDFVLSAVALVNQAC